MRKNVPFVLLSLLACSPMCASGSTSNAQEQSAVSLQGIIFISSGDQMKFLGRRMNQEGQFIEASSIPFIDQHPRFIRKLTHQYKNQHLTMEVADSICQMVRDFYTTQGHKLVRVTIPEQRVRNGIIYVLVEEAVVGQVTITGNRYFSTQFLKQQIRLEHGKSFDLNQLKEDMAWINHSPFRKADVVLSPGSRENSTDVTVEVDDRWPYRFYTGVDNTGSDTTGNLRLFTGINFGNLFGIDQRLSYQFSSGTSYDQFHAHTVDYLAPLPWRHQFHVYGGYSESQPRFIEKDLHLDGKSWQVDFRYEIPFNQNSNALLQQINLGFDVKRMNNNLDFGGDEVQRQYVNVIQGVLQYEQGVQNAGFRSNLELALYASPGGIGKDNTTHAFQTLRRGANSTYCIVGGEWSSGYRLHPTGVWLTLDTWGQFASTNLLPTEQLTLSGYNSIRGYEQSAIMVDNGVGISTELHTPSFSPLELMGCKRCYDQFYFLGFVDYGWGRDHHRIKDEKPSINVLAVGVGARYQIRNNVSARFDYAFPLLDAPYSSSQTQRVFFGVVVSY